MNLNERLLASVLFGSPDRSWRYESMGFWDETLSRWHGEGLPKEVDDRNKLFLFNKFDFQSPIDFDPSNDPGVFPHFEEEILREEGDNYIKKTKYGSVGQVPKDGHSTIPHFIEFPVNDRKSWETFKERLDPDAPGRLDGLDLFFHLSTKEGWPMWVYICGLFGTHRHLFGVEPLMYAYYDQPELLHDISRHWLHLWKTLLGKIAGRHRPELVFLWEDMCGRGGPIISPATFDAFMAPYYRELVDFMKRDLGIPIVAVDTDGDMNLLIPKFVDAGVNMLLPFEVQAGMDILKVREQWPREFAIWGGMDKRELAKGRKAIEAEVKRIVPSMLGKGGYIPSIDHSVPPDVSFENWIFYRDLVRETVDTFYGIK